MATSTAQDLDFQWFLDHYDSLFQQYGESYLAIKNEKVIGSFPSYAEAVEKTEQTEELGSFIVQYCNGDESAYTAYIAPVISVGA